jgi:hypothetical protein
MSEHILFLQRRQRSFLGQLGAAAARLQFLSSALSAFVGNNTLHAEDSKQSLFPPQVRPEQESAAALICIGNCAFASSSWHDRTGE